MTLEQALDYHRKRLEEEEEFRRSLPRRQQEMRERFEGFFDEIRNLVKSVNRPDFVYENTTVFTSEDYSLGRFELPAIVINTAGPAIEISSSIEENLGVLAGIDMKCGTRSLFVQFIPAKDPSSPRPEENRWHYRQARGLAPFGAPFTLVTPETTKRALAFLLQPEGR